MRLWITCITLIFILALNSSLSAQPDWLYKSEQPHVTAWMMPESEWIQPGKPFWVGVTLSMEKDWHTYWKNPGDSGLPTSIEWQLPPGFTAGEMNWPYPKKIETPPLVSYGYEDIVTFPVLITPPANLKDGEKILLQAKVSWLVCKDICLPGEANLKLHLKVAKNPPKDTVPSKAPPLNLQMKARRKLLPIPLPQIDRIPEDPYNILPFQRDASIPASKLWWVESKRVRQNLHITFKPTSVASKSSVTHATFFPEQQGIVNTEEGNKERLESKLDPGTGRDHYTLVVPLLPDAAKREIRGVVAVTFLNSFEQAVSFELQQKPESDEPESNETNPNAQNVPLTNGQTAFSQVPQNRGVSFFIYLFSAFLGGIILNLMPCVFPVLSLKILNFIQQSNESRWKLRMHGILFALGVLMSFWALAGLLLILRSAGEEIGWGFQLQNPLIVGFLAMLLFALGLNLMGVFEINIPLWARTGQGGNGFAGSFWSGVLATIVATPCTAPFMGAALAFALVQNAWIALSIFTALALGLATPYLIFAFFPALFSWLPKPGTWMESFKQAMAFPLFGAVIWLIWVLAQQGGSAATLWGLIALLLLALALWIYGRWNLVYQPNAVRWSARILSLLFFTLGLMALSMVEAMPSSILQTSNAHAAYSGIQWEPYSPERIEALKQEKRIILIDFTAAWCLTCQVNKKIVFESERVQKRLKELNVAMIEADWTSQNQAITRALQSYGRTGVPTYVLYRPDGTYKLLPEILTPDLFLSEIEAAQALK